MSRSFARGRRDFATWQARCRLTTSGKGSQTVSHEHDETFSAQQLEKAKIMAIEMCEQLLHSIDGVHIDPAAEHLMEAIHSAYELPAREVINVAVTGSQGKGKSSLLIALVGKAVVDVSAGGRAETSYPQIIEWKQDAPDDTTRSDISITFMTDDQFRECGSQHLQDFLAFINSSQTQAPPRKGPTKRSTYQGIFGSGSQEEIQDRQIFDQNLRHGYETAEEYFGIVFGSFDIERFKSRVTPLSHGSFRTRQRFLDDVVANCRARIAEFADSNNWDSGPDDTFEQTDVDISDLPALHHCIKDMWPLVENVTISTGSELLRRGLRFIDLPGNDDCNLIRAASVNKYQREADYEIVVAWSQRYETEKQQDTYLGEAVHQHGQEKTILVFNQIDLHAGQIAHKQLEDAIHMAEAPFLELRECLEYANQNPDTLSDKAITGYEGYIHDRLKMAIVELEISKIGQKLDRTSMFAGVSRFAVSALQYINQMVQSPNAGLIRRSQREHTMRLDPVQTGIPALRLHLIACATDVNRRQLVDHMQEKLAYVVDESERFLSKYRYNQVVIDACNELRSTQQSLKLQLEDLANQQCDAISASPWTLRDRPLVMQSLEEAVEQCKQPKVYHQTFNKMLRTYGIDYGRGRSRGLNLNKCLLDQYRAYLDTWKDIALNRIGVVKKSLRAFLSKHLTKTQTKLVTGLAAIGASSLAQAVRVEIHKVSKGIDRALDKLRVQLVARIWSIYRRYTTERDISDPIVTIMHPRYSQVSCADHRGTNKHKTQRGEIVRLMNYPSRPTPSLESSIRSAVHSAQNQLWKSDCQAFATDAMQLTSSLPRNLEVLLDKQGRIQTTKFYKELQSELPQFADALDELRSFLG